MSADFAQKIVSLIARHKGLDPKTITLTSTLVDLGVSSLDAITIVYELEDDLGIHVPNEQLESLRTVEDIVTGLQRLMQESARQ